MKRLATPTALATFCALASHAAVAGTIVDQLPTNTQANNGTGYSSQFFEPRYAAYDIATVDSFTLTAATDITSISAALLGGNGFTSYSNITGYSVEIYSSAAAAANNLTGDVSSVSLAPGAVLLTFPYTLANTALVDIPLNILLAAGTYDFAVIPTMSVTKGGQVYVLTNGLPGTAFQANPGGAFGFPGNLEPLGIQAGYEVDGNPIPEPASLAAFTVGLAALGLTRRRRA